MSETPQRSVLKEMLMKLKAKVIDSQKMFFGLSITMSATQTQTLRETLENVLKMPEGETKTSALLTLSLFNGWNQNLNLLSTVIVALINDMNLYIETLERYSTELDNTLTEIFTQAKQYAEQQQKQQEELKKKEPTYRT